MTTQSPWLGGCQCGAVRYEMDAADIMTVYCCHCRECRRQAASAFGISVILPRSAFRLVRGTLHTWQRRSDRGTVNRGSFCSACGVRMFHDGGADRPEISLKGGSLDDVERLHPIGHIWTARALSWVRWDDGLLCYSGQPPDYEALQRAYRTLLKASHILP